MNAEIQKMMKILGCSEEEAREIVQADKAIDKGESCLSYRRSRRKQARKPEAPVRRSLRFITSIQQRRSARNVPTNSTL